tara:strand:+ start:1809 stop:2087 length:279 start_codon:yes stop_codon:yes gene_type:complete
LTAYVSQVFNNEVRASPVATGLPRYDFVAVWQVVFGYLPFNSLLLNLMKKMAVPDPARRIPMKTKTIIFLNNLVLGVNCLFSQIISDGSEAS